MDFGDILAQWENTQENKKMKKKEIKQPTKQKENIMERILSQYPIIDKDEDIQKKKKASMTRTQLHQLAPEAEIDLHGMTKTEAFSVLDTFFDTAVKRKLKKVRIIHGKGIHSKGEAVLRDAVQLFLQGHPHAGESGFCKANAGGSGSTWVLLK